MAKGTLTVKVLGDTKPFEKSMGKVGGIAKAGFAAAGAAAVAGIAVSVKAFADFDQAMTQSTAIMGNVSDEMRTSMANAAREVAKTTTFSAKEAAESYFYLASAGMDAEQSIAALPQVAAFAQAGMFDMATATDLATDAQSALGLASDDAEQNLKNLTRVTDVFVRANTLANTSVEQIAEAMTNKAGAAMRSVGMDIEEGSAVLAAFADQGVKGSEAGTQFAIVLRDLQTKALKNSEAFAKAGVSVFDANGEFRNMGDIVGDLEGYLDGMSDAQKKAAMAALGFSDKSMGALQTLLGTSDAIREYEGELRSAGGFTQDVAGKQMETFNAQVGLLKDRFMDVAIGVGSVVVPMLLDAMDALVRGFEWVSEKMAIVIDIFRNPDITSDGWIGAVERVVVGFIAFRDTVTAVLDTVAGWFRRSSDDISGATSELSTFLATTWAQISGIIKSATDAILAIFRFFRDVATDLWQRFGRHILEFLSGTWDRIKQVIGGVLKAIQGVFEIFAGIFTGDWSRVWDGIKMVLSGVWDAIKGIVAQAFEAIKTILGLGVAAISVLWSAAWDRIKLAFSAWWSDLKSEVSTGIAAVSTFFSELPGKILSALGNVGSLLVDAGRSILDGLWRGLKEKWESVKGWVGGLGNKIKGLKGPISVDKRLLIPEGEAIMRSLGIGLERVWPRVASTLSDITRQIPNRVDVEASTTYSRSTEPAANTGIMPDPEEWGRRAADAMESRMLQLLRSA